MQSQFHPLVPVIHPVHLSPIPAARLKAGMASHGDALSGTAGPAIWFLNRAMPSITPARRFGTYAAWMASHPEGKGAGDYREPSKNPDTDRKPVDSGRGSDRGGTPTPTRDGTRSGGSSEKWGFASVERQPDAPQKGGKGDIDRPATPTPATRDPDGSLNRRGGTTDPAVSWGGGGSDLGGGGSNDGLF